MPISDQVLADLREVVQATRHGSAAVAAMNHDERLVFRVLPELLDEVESLRRERDSTLAKDFIALYQAVRMLTSEWQPHEHSLKDNLDVQGLALHVTRLAPLYDDVRRSLVARRHLLDPAHTVNVLHEDGTTSVECDHKFIGLEPSRCAHCGKPFAELRREGRREAAGVDVVSIALGPTLRARVDELVKTNRLGRTLAHVAQTLFVLGLLDAEGQDPRSHFGEPVTHFSVDGVFVRFALPHEIGDESRREILRSLFAWLHAWLGDDERLQRSATAALEALPRT